MSDFLGMAGNMILQIAIATVLIWVGGYSAHARGDMRKFRKKYGFWALLGAYFFSMTLTYIGVLVFAGIIAGLGGFGP